MNVLIILKTIFLYIKNLFYLKGFGTQCAPYSCFINTEINLNRCWFHTNYLIKSQMLFLLRGQSQIDFKFS